MYLHKLFYHSYYGGNVPLHAHLNSHGKIGDKEKENGETLCRCKVHVDRRGFCFSSAYNSIKVKVNTF